MNAKQDWENAFGDKAIEVLENNLSDVSFALAEAMKMLNIEHGRIGEYDVYLASDGSASAIRLNGDNKRIPSRAEEMRQSSSIIS